MVSVYVVMLFFKLKIVGFLAPVLIFGLLIAQKCITDILGRLLLDHSLLQGQRGKVVYEMMNGVKTIKLNAWEMYIYNKLKNIRGKEQYINKLQFYYTGLESMITNFMPIIVGFASFWMYSYFYEPLSNAKIFSLLAMFNQIANPMKYLMMAYRYDMKVEVSDDRLEELKSFAQR